MSTNKSKAAKSKPVYPSIGSDGISETVDPSIGSDGISEVDPSIGSDCISEVDPSIGSDGISSENAILEENTALKEMNECLLAKIKLLEAGLEELAAAPAIPGTGKTGTLASIKNKSAENEPFEVDGKMYRLKVAELSIRKVGKRTALDIISDDEPNPLLGNLTIKEWLVKNNSSALVKL